jgi:hypothetical protein
MAIRRSGHMNAENSSGELALAMIEWANRIIEDVNNHPNYLGDQLPYYISLSDVRPIPDMIVLDGLVFHLAMQQMSEKAPVKQRVYYQTLNQLLSNRRFAGNPRLNLSPVELSGSFPVPNR